MMFLVASITGFAQNNGQGIKGKWIVEKFQAEANSLQSAKTARDLTGLYLTFGDEELTISRKSQTGDSIIKRGPYSVSENTVMLGKDQAEIILLSNTHLTIKLPGQGMLFLRKL